MKTVRDIRRTFLDYFARYGHHVVPSSPLVPHNDPTLMFTNAGMVQFKNIFTGQEALPFSQAVSSQKCVRAGGKHNDLDNVGYTARHHTFFEMLGNFSFGDYFKEEAIGHAWRVLTSEFALPQEKMLVTVHSSDEEAATLWRRIAGLPDQRIIRIPTSDNFWMMGETGPCGPCSEIFFDHGPSIPGGPPGSAEEDGDRFVEIWNLVFMQFEQIDAETRINLPRPSIDTGMGLERFAALLQGQHDNYDTDLMRGLIEAVANAAGTDPDGPHRISHRVLADHIRSVCFLMADGVLPSNEGRGYVLRRIMRRAMRHAYTMGCADPLMHRLVPALITAMGETFPELGRASAFMTETLRHEETRFRHMLERGLRLLDAEKARLSMDGVLPGTVAFTLYDTYGFPLDLTQDALRAEGYQVDVQGFNVAMQAARDKARQSWVGSGDSALEKVWFEAREQVGATEFLGYTSEQAEGKVVALIAEGRFVDTASAGQDVYVITNQTPFYGESGGQIGDHGTLTATSKNGRIDITDTQKKLGDVIVHVGKVSEGDISLGATVHLAVDTGLRAAVRANHSATHLLHAALRQRLGEHVTQKGSSVGADGFRLDVSYPQAVSREDLAHIEQDVNAAIRANAKVTTRIMDPESAIQSGAMALFGEKYGDAVRVVQMGALSTELCGGTHVNRTGDIGLFRIVSESAVGSGVRRIEACTGQAALEWTQKHERRLHDVVETLKVASDDLVDRAKTLVSDYRTLERKCADLQRQAAVSGGAQSQEPEHIGDISFLPRLLEGVPGRDLKSIADDMMKRLGEQKAIIALASIAEGKASLVVAVSADLVADGLVADGFDARELVRVGAVCVGGKGGGGRPDLAQAGGPDGRKAQSALQAIKGEVAEKQGSKTCSVR